MISPDNDKQNFPGVSPAVYMNPMKHESNHDVYPSCFFIVNASMSYASP
jgi:hypothetical protein